MKTFKKFVLALTLVCVFNFFIFLYDIKSKNLNHYKSKKSFKKNKIKISLMHIPKHQELHLINCTNLRLILQDNLQDQMKNHFHF